MLFCAVIAFLAVTMLDFQRDRDAPVLEKRKSVRYNIAFGDVASRGFEQTVSLVIGVALAVAFAFLLWDKWLG